jgi:hypothetical protein
LKTQLDTTKHPIVFTSTIVGANLLELFNINELEPSVGQLVNQNVGVWDVFYIANNSIFVQNFNRL